MSDSEGSRAAPPEDSESSEAGGYVADPPEPSWSCRPLQSVIEQRCSRRVGLPAPGLVLALAERPSLSGIPAAAHAQGSDSLSNPLMGFGPPTRYFPLSPPLASQPRAPLVGFLSPSAHQEERGHVRPGCPVRLPGLRRDLPAGPTLPATASPAGFSNLSATSSTLRRPAIFRQVALLGFTLQGFVPLAQPRRLVAPGMPSWRSSRWLRSLRPRQRSQQARAPLPRMARRCVFVRLQGLRPHENRSASPSHV